MSTSAVLNLRGAIAIFFAGSLTVFGESLGLPSRMVLIYDGIHYDPLYSTGPAGQVPRHGTQDTGLGHSMSLAEGDGAPGQRRDPAGAR